MITKIRCFMFLAGISFLFIICADGIFVVNYFKNIAKTYNETKNSYEILKPYVELNLYKSFFWVLILLLLILNIVLFCCRAMKADNPRNP